MDWTERYGPWALVTGASSGIGEEFVLQLSARRMNVVLLARRKERMEAIAARVEEDHGVQARVVEADLTQNGACEEVARQTADLGIGLLVNNAGFGLSGSFDRLDPEQQGRMTVLNCVVPVLLTGHFLPPMLERGHGGLIFLASTAAYQPTPFLGVYGATKAFNLMLGEALWKELRKEGVDSMALSPGFTKTEFSDVAGIKDAGAFRESTSDRVVTAALSKLGSSPSVVQGLMNKLLAFSVRILPRRTVMAITGAALKGRTRT